MTKIFKIRDARVRHINGLTTQKELRVEVIYQAEDSDGHFENWTTLSIPLGWNDLPIGEHPGLVGKEISVVLPL